MENEAEKKAAKAAGDEKAKEQPQLLPGREYPLEEAMKMARESSKARKFQQTWDFVISLKGLDLKKTEHRFTAEMPLPKGKGRDAKVAVFADLMAAEAKKVADIVITKAEIEDLASNKKKMKKIANEYDFFFGEAPLMPQIGKSLGTVLGPRGKVPKPMPPKGNIAPMINASKHMIRISLKETPVIYANVGNEKMDDKDVADNIRAVYNFVVERLPKGRNNVKSTIVKLTMGKPVKANVKK